MSKIIKSTALGNVTQIRALRTAPPHIPPSAEMMQIQYLQAKVAEWEQASAARDAQINALEIEVEQSYLRGHCDGVAIGHLEAKDSQEARFTLLAESASRAENALRERLEEIERLAALLARESLATLLGDPDQRTALVLDIIRHQVAQIDSSALVLIEVSSTDFPDGDHLESLRQTLCEANVQIMVRPALESGDCRMVLQLGQLEIGLGQQWGTLYQVLTDMVESEAAQ